MTPVARVVVVLGLCLLPVGALEYFAEKDEEGVQFALAQVQEGASLATLSAELGAPSYNRAPGKGCSRAVGYEVQPRVAVLRRWRQTTDLLVPGTSLIHWFCVGDDERVEATSFEIINR
jgi:hypothetical protein